MGKCVSVNKDSKDPIKDPPNSDRGQGSKKQQEIAKRLGVKRAERPAPIQTGKSASAPKLTLPKTEPTVRSQLQRKISLRHPSASNYSKEAANALVSTERPSHQESKEILDILKGHFLFSMMPTDTLKILIGYMKTLTLEKNQIIYIEGKIGANFYLVRKGRLEVKVGEVASGTLEAGQCFGELALIQDKERSNTVTTLEKCVLKSIDRLKYREILATVNESKQEENFSFIETIPIFKKLTKVQTEQLLTVIVTMRYNPGDVIVTEGEEGDLFYIIKEGTVTCSKKNQFIREFNRGEFFGEQALMYKSKRRATCKAVSKVVIISISRNDLTRALGQGLEKIIYRNTVRIAFEQNPYIKNLSQIQTDLVIDKMDIKTYAANDIVIPQGTVKGNSIYIILKGILADPQTKFRLYDIIGDEEIAMESCKRIFKSNIIAEEESDVASISKVSFEEFIGGSLKSVVVKNNLVDVLKSVPLLKIIPMAKLQDLVSLFELKEFNVNDVIFEQDSHGDSFYIVKEGSVDILKDGVVIRKVQANGYFGERAILLDEVRTATIKSTVITKCWVLSKVNFKRIIDPKMRQELLKRIELQNEAIPFENLLFIDSASKGIYTNSFVCNVKNTPHLYLLRTMSRNSLALSNTYTRASMELKILKRVDFPLISKLIKTYKDSNRIYFLMEFIAGQDLFDVLSTKDRLSNEQARFYAAGLLLIIEYLHSHIIIYRDFKPENIMIDALGYPKLFDFGNAKIVENRTYSILGTSHYMAPEIIAGKGYGVFADYWSLGVMIYEFMFNKLPFASDETDCFEIYRSILEDDCVFPAGNHLVKPLLDQLLMKNPTLRGNYRTLKAHSWFIGVNWDMYVAKEIKAPFKPKVQNYDKEIAVVNNKAKNELIERILREENKESLPKKGGCRPPENWDVDF